MSFAAFALPNGMMMIEAGRLHLCLFKKRRMEDRLVALSMQSSVGGATFLPF